MCMLSCMLSFLHASLGCRTLTVLFGVHCYGPAHDLCFVHAHVLRLAVLLVPPLVCIAALCGLLGCV